MSWDKMLKSLVTAGLVLTVVVLAIDLANGWGFISPKPSGSSVQGAKLVGHLSPPPTAARAMGKGELAYFIGPRDLDQADIDYFEISGPDGQPLFVKTTLDPGLQTEALKWVKGSGALRTALVVLDPSSGRVLAMAGYGNPEGNAALEGSFPAASVFKIVTAAAAVEKAEYNSMTKVAYDGSKHTLYKANLSKGPDQGVHQATLKDGFAESINSVFGKLGAFSLEPTDLEEMALNFGFNETFSFELPLSSSFFPLGEDPNDTFRLAELASGFNRDTRLSPVHGALIASVAINGGELFEPTIVSEVFDLNNKAIYHGAPRLMGRAVSLQTAEELSVMMQAAISDGTGRKRFSDADRNPVLSKLIIGGKSGTINDESGAKVDWFVAFASPASDDGIQDQLALAAVVVHDGQTNVGSQELVRKALMTYYKERLSSVNGKRVVAGQKYKPIRSRS
jgi:cell division protein FtsI/penicillin-binding protein 2